MTNTSARLQIIAKVCQHPNFTAFMGDVSLKDLNAWIDTELGHPNALENFHSRGSLLSKAYAPQTILHIVSGNTPHTAIQSLLRGLVLGSYNIIKLPSSGIPVFENWLTSFPKSLREMVETTKDLTDEHFSRADAIIATGSDSTILAIQKRILPHHIFIPHGHKISISIIYDDPLTAAPLAAKDVSLFNQRGCLSPHAIYVKTDARDFAKQLACALENDPHTPEPLTLSEAGAISNLRETTRFAAANSDSVQLWESAENLDWTVIYEASPKLHLSCLNRCIYVKPLPKHLSVSELGSEAQHLSSIAIHPFTSTLAEPLTALPAHRICPLGQSQSPSLLWHHDGFSPLASLVKWKDIG